MYLVSYKSMKKLGLPKKKKITISQIKKKAWHEFSLYIRLKHADADGFVTCYTCGKRAHYKDGMQAGHGIAGRNNSVLFDERVVKVQCVGCNYFGGGQPKIFTKKLIEEMGAEAYSQVLMIDSMPKKMTILDYQAVFEAYRDLNRQLLEEKI